MIDQEKIHKQCLSEDPKKRIKAVKQLKSNFSLFSDTQKAWGDLHRLTTDEDIFVRYEVAPAIGSAFSQILDKQQAWEDLHRLTNDPDHFVRFSAASTLGSTFSNMPDKKQAWYALLKLISDEESVVRLTAAQALSSAFNSLPDKQQAWDDLHRLTSDGDSVVRSRAADALGSAFFQIPDKQQAWEDLHRLTNDEDWRGRAWAASAIGLSFIHIPDKQQAWNDLHRLTSDEDSSVRSSVASATGSASSYLLDKEQVWNDLYRLTIDQDAEVRREATSSLGLVFPDIADKQRVWNDLQRLTSDEDEWVRAYANYVLGKVSIFKASHTENEDNYRDELEMAIAFFEKASQESPLKGLNPAHFCLPFYRSFHTIVFKKHEAKEEVDKYLAEAKDAIKGSKSKETLLEAVKNLAEALKEVQSLEKLDLEAKKGDLNFYRIYCDRAAELMIDTKDTAPYATAAMRKGLPILDRNLKSLLDEIQRKAKIACKESIGTPTEEIACTVSREVQKWEIGSQEEMSWFVENLIFTLESSVPRALENQAIFDKIEQIREEKMLVRQYAILCSIVPMIPNLHVKQALSRLEEEIHEIKEKVDNLTITLKPGIKEEFEISSGIEILGTGAKHIVTIPLQEISYAELKEDLKRIKGKHISKLSKLPERLARKIKGYLLLNDREDIVDQLI